MSIDELVKEDNTFNETKFIANVDNTYIMLLSAIINGNLDKVNHKISDEVYNKYKSLIDELNSKNIKQMYDELNVKSTRIIDIQKDNNDYIIKVELISRYLDYIVEKDTNKYISGNQEVRREVRNILTFKKKIDAKDFDLIKKCPTCGGDINYNSDGVCKYCHNTFNTEEYDFVLVDIEN